MKGSIIEISYDTAINFVLPRHYSGRKPQVTKAFGWYSCESYVEENLMAVCTFGKPASPTLCDGICGKEFSSQVYELNRLCRKDEWGEPLSEFVGACLRRLRTENWIIVSYSDTAMNHHGYIYQATNFLYTGCTKQRTDKYSGNGKHSRHYEKNITEEYRQIRSPKHRYVYFCTFDKKLKKNWIKNLKYKILPYPKGDNSSNYELGNFIQPNIYHV